MKVLVSVRSVDEALAAARAGVHFIDLKEPREGALGALPLPTIRAIVQALREQPRAAGLTVSATVGDWPAHALDAITAQVRAVAACGVDLVKVGVARDGPCDGRPDDGGALALLRHLASMAEAGRGGLRLVPVLLADRGLDAPCVRQAAHGPFAAVMVDTADKRAGTLFDCVPEPELRRFIDTVRAAGLEAGVAGALRLADVPRLRALRPGFAGFRSAVCAGDRTQGLDRHRLATLLEALAPETARPA